jgi:putative transposase
VSVKAGSGGRLMRAHGIRGASRAKKRFTTRRDAAAVPVPDLLERDFSATAPNENWVADFTYCSTWSGVIYVAFVVDVFSRLIVGWKAARTIATSLVLDTLNMAAWTPRGLSLDELVCHPAPAANTPPSPTPSGWTRSGRRPPSAASATTRTTTPWPSR